jgi:vacuolar-type H+-ATPase subunit E/Vma4
MGGQAREEADKLVADVRDEAARLVAAAEAQRQETLARTKAEVEAQAKLEARNRLDRAELESKRQTGQTKEAILRQVFSRALARLQEFRQSPAYPDWLSRGLLATLKQLEGQQFQVVAHPEEALAPRSCWRPRAGRPGPNPGPRTRLLPGGPAGQADGRALP